MSPLARRPDLLQRIRALLGKATSLNTRYAAAYDFLASVSNQLGDTDTTGLALRAVSLEPADAHHHLTAARLLASAHQYDEALKQVDLAAELADSDTITREAADLKTWIQRQRQ